MIERKRPDSIAPASRSEFFGPGEPANRQEWAARINSSWRKATQSIIQTGCYLNAAKGAMDPADYKAMLEKDLHFDRATAVKLIAIAKDERICSHVNRLPPHFTALYELTKIEGNVFEAAIANEKIHPGMERKYVQKLLPPAEKKTRTAAEIWKQADNSVTEYVPQAIRTAHPNPVDLDVAVDWIWRSMVCAFCCVRIRRHCRRCRSS
jgi:hypothetical protein